MRSGIGVESVRRWLCVLVCRIEEACFADDNREAGRLLNNYHRSRLRIALDLVREMSRHDPHERRVTCHNYARCADKLLVPSGSHDNDTIRYRSRWVFDRSSTGPLCRGSLHIVPVPAFIRTEYHQRHFTRGAVPQATEVAMNGRSGIRRIPVLCFTCSMIQTEMFPTVEGKLAMRGPSQTKRNAPSDTPSVIERLATMSSRTRYAITVLNLIARAAGESEEAGPYVVERGNAVRLRDWLCDALSPMAPRDPRRI
jgi:hypothetical protein